MDAGSVQYSSALAMPSAQGTSIESLQSSLRNSKPAEAARKFESLFASLLVKEMRQTLAQGFFGEGPQADVYGGWLDQFVGDAIARDGGLNLAKRLEGDLIRAQAARDAFEQAQLSTPTSADPLGGEATTAVSTTADNEEVRP